MSQKRFTCTKVFQEAATVSWAANVSGLTRGPSCRMRESVKPSTGCTTAFSGCFRGQILITKTNLTVKFQLDNFQCAAGFKVWKTNLKNHYPQHGWEKA